MDDTSNNLLPDIDAQLSWAHPDADSSKLLRRCKEALAARDATIAEQAEALEGYRSVVCAIPDCAVEPIESGIIRADMLADFAVKHLPAHEIAVLRERGVEVGEVDGSNQ